MRKSRAIALMITMLVGLTTSCATKKQAVVEEPSVARAEIREWQDECTVGEENSTCPNKTLSWVYHTMFDLFHDGRQLKSEMVAIDANWQLEVDSRDAKLDEWFRKWWLTIPLGILAGVTIAAATYLGIEFRR